MAVYRRPRRERERDLREREERESERRRYATECWWRELGQRER